MSDKEMKEELARLRIALETCKNDYWFMINLLEKYSYNLEESVNDCINRMKFRKPLFNILKKVQNEHE